MHRTDRGARQSAHRVGHRVHHATHDAVASLVQCHLDQRVLVHRLHQLHRVRVHRAVLQGDSLAQPVDDLVVNTPFHIGEVGLEHLVGRMCHAVGELSVIGEQDEPRGLGVQPADVEESDTVRHPLQVGEIWAALRIVHRRDDATRLVEHVVDVPACRGNT